MGSGVSGGGAGRFAGFLLLPPDMQALALGWTFEPGLARFAGLACHVCQLLVMSNDPPAQNMTG